MSAGEARSIHAKTPKPRYLAGKHSSQVRACAATCREVAIDRILRKFNGFPA